MTRTAKFLFFLVFLFIGLIFASQTLNNHEVKKTQKALRQTQIEQAQTDYDNCVRRATASANRNTINNSLIAQQRTLLKLQQKIPIDKNAVVQTQKTIVELQSYLKAYEKVICVKGKDVK